MPANPGAKKAQEKARKKREAAQKQRKVQNATQKRLDERKQVEAAAQQEAIRNEPPPGPDEPLSPYFNEEGKQVDFDELDALGDKVQAHIKKKAFDDAEHVAGEISRKFPTYAEGLYRLGTVHEARGHKDQARATYELALLKAGEGDSDIETERAIQKRLDKLS